MEGYSREDIASAASKVTTMQMPYERLFPGKTAEDYEKAFSAGFAKDPEVMKKILSGELHNTINKNEVEVDNNRMTPE